MALLISFSKYNVLRLPKMKLFTIRKSFVQQYRKRNLQIYYERFYLFYWKLNRHCKLISKLFSHDDVVELEDDGVYADIFNTVTLHLE